MVTTKRLEFKRRAEIDLQLRGLLQLRHWVSKCGRYRVSESSWLGHAAEMPTAYIASRLDGGCWCVIRRCRTRSGAERSCSEHQRNRTDVVSRSQDADRVTREGTLSVEDRSRRRTPA